MISLILPYWDRQAAADKALRLIEKNYSGIDLEVVVVDDGSGFVGSGVKVVRLPKKEVPLNPCVPFNRGVEASSGEFIALSNSEILHNRPVLAQMRDEICDESDYVMAACWGGRWHCHSSRERTNDNDVGAYLPKGSDYHFMTMMKRSLWEKAGGFDEDYRDGAGYDDPDFVRRLHRAGARFVRRDDLVVEHPRAGAHAKWTPEMFARNRKVFMSKWQPLEAH